ncbi:uncharacterized protein LOC130182106 [Seriola aureovittata]|uniref:uncharacterized protein LOC130182106 n=1 Tax=Seriola aureovittata TaxID=2871759 RepID=UPI0024BE46D2|nr:uncharacterized protein LOC130182106 [Seriola aureovittata]
MNGLLFLLYCVEILGALLCGVKGNPEITSGEIGWVYTDDEEISHPTQQDSTQLINDDSSSAPEDSRLINVENLTTVSLLSSSLRTSPSPAPQKPTTTTTTTTSSTTTTSTSSTRAPNGMFFQKECLTVYMVTGGLIIACSILLASTLLLTWRVCHLNRHLKMLSTDADLISTSQYWMGTARKNKSKSETQAKDTSMLMADFSQTQEDTAGGTTKEEEAKVDEDGQKGEEKKGDTASSEKASAGENKLETIAAENSPSSGPPEETSPEAVAASSSEATQKPQDEV